jgi:nitronate monooxygenase
LESITSLLGVELPLIQAPMAGVQDEALPLAVAAAGGLGSMPCALLNATQLEAALQRFASVPVPINLNFFCHRMAEPNAEVQERWLQALLPYYEEFRLGRPVIDSSIGARRPIDAATVEVLEGFRPRVLSFHFGLPETALLRRIKAWGALVLASATTREEGEWLQAHGADIVIAQGIEAGGHRGHFLSDDYQRQPSTHALGMILSTTLSVPVVAAGGIGSRADVESLLDAGAHAVQAGTAYLLCPECRTSSVHRAALQDPYRATGITNLFTGGAARGLVNRLMAELGPMSELAPPFPWAAAALAPLRARAESFGQDDFTPMWSGSGPNTFAGLSAAQVTHRLAGRGSIDNR